MTPVIFRKFPDNQVIAFFPTHPGTNEAHTCDSYMHVGQHASGGVDAILDLKPASEPEYRDLLRELVRIGYDDLRVYKRYQFWFTAERLKELNRHYATTVTKILTTVQ